MSNPFFPIVIVDKEKPPGTAVGLILPEDRHKGGVLSRPQSLATQLAFLQLEIAAWNKDNFPEDDWHRKFMGVVEEVGELSHALLKQEQGIRGTDKELEAKAKDAVGDILIYLFALCAERGWSLGQCLEDTWNEVSERDWSK